MIFRFLFLFVIFFSFSTSASCGNSIFSSSTTWDEKISIKNLPQWSYANIESLFNAYLQSPQLRQDEHLYNLQFIHAFWGPVNNPFVKLARPAKIFVFVENAENYFVAPIMQDMVDGNIYVYDMHQRHPMLLVNWIAEIRNKFGYEKNLRVNICDGYGSLPRQECGISFQGEVEVVGNTVAMLNVNRNENFHQEQSARRNLNDEWDSKEKNLDASLRWHDSSNNLNDNLPHFPENPNSIRKLSVNWKNLDKRNKLFASVPTWKNFRVIENNFQRIRNLRYFVEEDNHHFMRRITWLYPDDGCWTRASAVINNLFGPINNVVNNYARPAKVFAFGNLCALTNNSPNGYVAWGYHTAPVIRDAETNQVYVIDPSVNSTTPLKIETWIEKIYSRDGACKPAKPLSKIILFNICNGYGVGPMDECEQTYLRENQTVLTQAKYRQLERKRQELLGRDADAVLGKQPPW